MVGEADRLDGLHIQVGRSRPLNIIGQAAKAQIDRLMVYLRRSIAYTDRVLSNKGLRMC